jgi:hypothetical protein
MRRLLIVTLCGTALGMTALLGNAAPPRVEADPNQWYPITPEVGPWVVCVAGYMGPEGPNLAHQLVYQLRNKYHLQAYFFSHTDEERKRLREEFERKRKEYPELANAPHKTVRLEEQCAVFIGGYKDMEAARTALPAIKKLPPPDLRLKSGEAAFDAVGPAIRTDEGNLKMETKPVNPFSTCFVTRNPACGQQHRATVKFDPIWEKLNANEEYSLLNCKKRWTLLVQEYHGNQEYQGVAGIQPKSSTSGFLNALGLAGKSSDALDAAGAQAHELAHLLHDRSYNLEAYVLHTRNNSMVTVGGFDQENDEEMQRAKDYLASLQFTTKDKSGRVTPIKLLFDKPIPIPVPRKEP